MQTFLIAATASVLLISLTILVFYELLRAAWLRKDRFANKPRSMIYHLVVAIFAAHTVCVWLYGLAYWLMIDWWGIGSLDSSVGRHVLAGEPASFERLLTCVYFSVTCYSSLGFGDLTPGGAIRMLSGIEAVNGLLLIGWSVTYTYFATDKYIAFTRRR